MTNKDIKKYLAERKYHLTAAEIEHIEKSMQIVKKEILMESKNTAIIKLYANDGESFRVIEVKNG